MLQIFHNLIPYIYFLFLNDIAIKKLNIIYKDKKIKGLSEIYKYIIKHIHNTN